MNLFRLLVVKIEQAMTIPFTWEVGRRHHQPLTILGSCKRFRMDALRYPFSARVNMSSDLSIHFWSCHGSLCVAQPSPAGSSP